MKISTLKTLLKKENGISLVEVVASIVMLAFIILSVYYMFVQSAKTTKTSGDIIDATYIAQTEMEELYLKSTNPTYDSLDLEDILTNELSYTKNIDGSKEYFNKLIADQFNIKITVTNNVNGYPQLTRIMIQVYEKNNGPLKAQMENTLDWGP